MPPTDSDFLDFENTEAAYDMLAERVEMFIEAWETGDGPPDLRRFLPDCATALLNMALVELIKVDLEYRRKNDCPCELDDYFEQFPELLANGAVPFDLIYEDFHLRKQFGETVVLQPYFDRFPDQRTKLEQMLGLGNQYQSTRVYTSSTSVEVEPGQQIDDFDLIKELGAGAFAKVYLARQVSMQRFVALKVSADQSDEPQTLAQLDHPHIVRVFDQRVIPEKQMRLLYMQYIPGGTLDDVIKTAKELPLEDRSGKLVLAVIDEGLRKRGELLPSESFARRALNDLSWPETVCRMGASLASALDYAHRRGVLHRDVKPANVLLTSEGSPKLADFNISFSSEVEGASPREFFGGSLAYMSPEQLEAYDPNHPRQPEDMDGRSDVYSLGVMLWEMLTGHRPFEDKMLPQGMEATIRDMTARRREGVPGNALRELPPDCPLGLQDVLLTCLQPEADHRFADASQLARQLELCLNPDTQHLLYPPHQDAWRARVARWPMGWLLLAMAPKSWRRTVVVWPLLTIFLAVLLGNVPLSVVNVFYNLSAIIYKLGEDPAEFFENMQVTIVNVLAYGIGIGFLVTLIWPVRSALRAVRQGEVLDDAAWRRCGSRCLMLGRYAFRIGVVIWVATSFAFPAWLQLAAPDADVALGDYFHFFTSTVICGLIAASLSYFLVTFICVRAFYPPLIPADADDREALDDLAQTGRPVTRYFFTLVAVPMLASAVAFFLFWLGAADREAAVSFGMLGVIGLLGFVLCLGLGRTILSDVNALRPAVCIEDAPHGDLETPSTLLGSTRAARG